MIRQKDVDVQTKFERNQPAHPLFGLPALARTERRCLRRFAAWSYAFEAGLLLDEHPDDVQSGLRAGRDAARERRGVAR